MAQPLQFPPVHIAALETAVPAHSLSQEDAAAIVAAEFAHVPLAAHMAGVFRSSGVTRRHLVRPPQWYLQPRSWNERNAVFATEAAALAEAAARACLEAAGVRPCAIAGIVLVSSTGIATPTLDATLLNRLGLSPAIERMPLFGLGCAAGALGLARAAMMARARPGTAILLVAVECCSLAYHPEEPDKASFISAALFGDGAAAAIVTTADDRPAMTAAGEHTWPDSLDLMGWEVRQNGLAVVLSRDIPRLVSQGLREVAASFLAGTGASVADMEGTICHPGGPKILDAVAAALPEWAGSLADSRAVLADHGNMSSPSVLFVLKRMCQNGRHGPHLMMALGPGFTAALVKVQL